MESNATKKPRIYVLAWLGCMAGLVGMGCRSLEDELLAEFPGSGAIIHVGIVVLFGLALVQVSIPPFFKEIGKELRW